MDHLHYHLIYCLRIYARYLQALGKEAGEAQLAKGGSAGHLAVLVADLAPSLNLLLLFFKRKQRIGFPCVPLARCPGRCVSVVLALLCFSLSFLFLCRFFFLYVHSRTAISIFSFLFFLSLFSFFLFLSLSLSLFIKFLLFFFFSILSFVLPPGCNSSFLTLGDSITAQVTLEGWGRAGL